MRLPTWFKGVLAAAVLGSLGWAFTDRMASGERLVKLETIVPEIFKRLDKIDNTNDRIERKLDEVIKEKK